jgi:hypothetical protein
MIIMGNITLIYGHNIINPCRSHDYNFTARLHVQIRASENSVTTISEGSLISGIPSAYLDIVLRGERR